MGYWRLIQFTTVIRAVKPIFYILQYCLSNLWISLLHHLELYNGNSLRLDHKGFSVITTANDFILISIITALNSYRCSGPYNLFQLKDQMLKIQKIASGKLSIAAASNSSEPYNHNSVQGCTKIQIDKSEFGSQKNVNQNRNRHKIQVRLGRDE